VDFLHPNRPISERENFPLKKDLSKFWTWKYEIRITKAEKKGVLVFWSSDSNPYKKMHEQFTIYKLLHPIWHFGELPPPTPPATLHETHTILFTGVDLMYPTVVVIYTDEYVHCSYSAQYSVCSLWVNVAVVQCQGICEVCSNVHQHMSCQGKG
jgi:hypothetical protein